MKAEHVHSFQEDQFITELGDLGLTATLGQQDCCQNCMEALASKVASTQERQYRGSSVASESLLLVSCSAELQTSKWPAFVSPSVPV